MAESEQNAGPSVFGAVDDIGRDEMEDSNEKVRFEDSNVKSFIDTTEKTPSTGITDQVVPEIMSTDSLDTAPDSLDEPLITPSSAQDAFSVDPSCSQSDSEPIVSISDLSGEEIKVFESLMPELPQLEDNETVPQILEKDDSEEGATDHPLVPQVNDEKNDSSGNESGSKKSEDDWVMVDKDEKENPYMDILGNGKLKKRVLNAGFDDSRPTYGEVVTVSCKGKLSDGHIVDVNNDLTFNLGDGDVIQAWDLCIALMNKNETAELITDARYAYGELGRAPDIPPNSTITYELKLVKVQEKVIYRNISVIDRIKLADKKRERGNDLFGRQEYTASVNSYSKALSILDDSLQSHNADASDLQKLLDMRLKCYNNLAAAQLKIDAYDAALKSCDAVLKYQPENVKALFRRGKALAAMGETDDAIKYLKKAVDLEPETKIIHQELSKLVTKKSETIEKEREMYRKMMGEPKNDKEKPKKISWLPWCGLFAGVVALAAIITGIVLARHSSTS